MASTVYKTNSSINRNFTVTVLTNNLIGVHLF